MSKENTDDNWEHRSANMRCRTCMFFVLKGEPDPGSILADLGRCRRRSPTLSGWPAVFSEDWCGDHKLDETKIQGKS